MCRKCDSLFSETQMREYNKIHVLPLLMFVCHSLSGWQGIPLTHRPQSVAEMMRRPSNILAVSDKGGHDTDPTIREPIKMCSFG